jgi:Ser-tRNA(Ala) deacylase AlaX
MWASFRAKSPTKSTTPDSKQATMYCILNWARRHKLMCSHTDAHVLAALLNKGTGALITGNQLEEDHVRFDFSLEKFDRALLEEGLAKANELFGTDAPVKWYEFPEKKP